MNYITAKKIRLTVLSLFIATVFFPSNIHAVTEIPGLTQSPGPTIPLPTPSGQTISLHIKIPGIGDDGGNFSPRNVTRAVTIYFFNPQINTEDVSTKPTGSVETTVEFDPDPLSPTYGGFVNSRIDVGSKIPDGKYQIVFKIDQALSTLIKEKDSGIGGKVFDVRESFPTLIDLKDQEVIIGDIHPNSKGDNVMDINDYNDLVSCFGTKAESESCSDFKTSDLNDDGKIDGVDYNLMFGSFKTLHSLGKPVPEFIAPKPTSKPTIAIKKPTPTPVLKEEVKDKKEPENKSSSGIIIPILLVIFLIAGIIFAVWKRQKAVDFFTGILHKNARDPGEEAESQEPIDEAIDKEFFVKKQTEDKANNTFVLTLTDDNGPTLGYYTGKDVVDGFAHVKGVLKKEGSKVFIEVSELTPVEPSA